MADDVPDTSTVAEKLQKSTVTLRISPVIVPADAEEGATAGTAPQTVTVSSGVSLGEGLVITFATMPATARYRVTLPDGGQATGKPRVIDFFSGLTLLEVEDTKLPGLVAAKETPKVGESVLTAAASGIEPPVVSLGILGAVDRTLSGSNLPPLLQCDVRTTDTSSGAALVNRYGDLIGIVAVAADDKQPGNWTYAVPVRHVQRLLRAKSAEQLVVLQRQRPTVGLTLETKGDTLTIERVTPGGPADTAGLKKGCTVLEVDGQKVRSVYQVVSRTLRKQPGDTLEFAVVEEGETRRVSVTLGGGTTISPTQFDRQRLAIEAVRRGEDFEIKRPGQAQPTSPLADASGDAPLREVDLLRRQLAAFELVIESLQSQLQQRDESEKATRQHIEALQKEVEQLRKRLEANNE